MENLNIEILSFEEIKEIQGGVEPGKDTSFWYDLSYYIVMGVKSYLMHDPGNVDMFV